MTFKAFQRTRKHVADIAAATGIDVGNALPGYVYDGGLHIFECTGHLDGDFQLIIHSEETISSDLAALERRLYAFAVAEDLFAHA